jgi:hypothetical protein
VRVSIESTVEITDVAALTQTVLSGVDAAGDQERARSTITESDQGPMAETVIANQALEALGIALDPATLVEAIDGVQLVDGRHTLMPISTDDLGYVPDFAALFPACVCGRESCERCSGFQMTPRSAACLWAAATFMADLAYDDIEDHGDEPVTEGGDWLLFHRYQRITWTQGAVWRRQAARTYDDLTADIEGGGPPVPRCFGEEMALHLMIEEAETAQRDGVSPLSDVLDHLPQHPQDFEWNTAREELFRDEEAITLSARWLDGIDDPEGRLNQLAGIGDMRPPAWFDPFADVIPRDGRRPFRR